MSKCEILTIIENQYNGYIWSEGNLGIGYGVPKKHKDHILVTMNNDRKVIKITKTQLRVLAAELPEYVAELEGRNG